MDKIADHVRLHNITEMVKVLEGEETFQSSLFGYPLKEGELVSDFNFLLNHIKTLSRYKDELEIAQEHYKKLNTYLNKLEYDYLSQLESLHANFEHTKEELEATKDELEETKNSLMSWVESAQRNKKQVGRYVEYYLEEQENYFRESAKVYWLEIDRDKINAELETVNSAYQDLSKENRTLKNELHRLKQKD